MGTKAPMAKVAATAALLFLVVLPASAQAPDIEKMLAVLDLDVQTTLDQHLKVPLTNAVIAAIQKTSRFQVIDRGHRDKILAEQEFQCTDMSDEACRVEMGKMLSVGRIVVGDVYKLGDTFILSLQLISVETGRIASVEEAECVCYLPDVRHAVQVAASRLVGVEAAMPTFARPPQGARIAERTGDAARYGAPLEEAQPTPPAPEGMVYVPGGTYWMGCSPGDQQCDHDEAPRHRVTFDAFFIDATEVTQSAYEKATGKTPSHFKDCGPDCPVEKVTWDDAEAYCQQVGKRLPTEAEWEYAARGGGETKWTCGAAESCVEAVGWHGGNSGRKTFPVGQKTANGYGAYDMAGNVWEWVADWYGDDYFQPARSGTPPARPGEPSGFYVAAASPAESGSCASPIATRIRRRTPTAPSASAAQRTRSD